MKISEKDKVLILLSSLSKSYDHIITTILYRKKTLILEEITTTLLSSEIRKMPNQDKQKGLGLMVMGRIGREGKKSPDSSKTCHFCHKEGHWKKYCKYTQEWLKKKRQIAEADIVEGVSDTYMLTTFIDNTSIDKAGY